MPTAWLLTFSFICATWVVKLAIRSLYCATQNKPPFLDLFLMLLAYLQTIQIIFKQYYYYYLPVCKPSYSEFSDVQMCVSISIPFSWSSILQNRAFLFKRVCICISLYFLTGLQTKSDVLHLSRNYNNNTNINCCYLNCYKLVVVL